VSLPGEGPWDPDRVSGLVVVITVIGVGIWLGLNWKRLGRPEWVQKTILLSVLVPVAGMVLTAAWILGLTQMSSAPFAVLMIVPMLVVGLNFGYAFGLARLQKGAYEKWHTGGADAMLAHRYDFKGAVTLGLGIVGAALIAGIFIVPLLR
jgi:hypothetical protein